MCDLLQGVRYRYFGMVGAVADTPSAVHAEIRIYGSLAVMYPYCLGGTVFDAVDAAGAGVLIQFYRIYKFIVMIQS